MRPFPLQTGIKSSGQVFVDCPDLKYNDEFLPPMMTLAEHRHSKTCTRVIPSK